MFFEEAIWIGSDLSPQRSIIGLSDESWAPWTSLRRQGTLQAPLAQIATYRSWRDLEKCCGVLCRASLIDGFDDALTEVE